MHWHIDLPNAGALCEPLNFMVQGWVFGEARHAAISRIQVCAQGQVLGQTTCLSLRTDVNAAWKLPAATRTGFEICCYFANQPLQTKLPIEIRVEFSDAPESQTIDARVISLVATDYRTLPFGHVLDANFLPVVHREHVYTSGPSLAVGSDECLALIEKYLGGTPRHILDVGCGLGFYGQRLRKAGHDWFGVDMKASDCAALARQGLPHQQVDGATLPFPSATFEAALAIEVLEHVSDLPAFLAEVQRVSPDALLVSVPNFEPVSYLNRHAVVPWHLLERDHKNFFTRWSLQHLLSQYYERVEVTVYHRMPLNTIEGTPLYYNLFARADGRKAKA